MSLPLDYCPACGAPIKDFDPNGCELPSGQRWCLDHLTDDARAELTRSQAELADEWARLRAGDPLEP